MFPSIRVVANMQVGSDWHLMKHFLVFLGVIVGFAAPLSLSAAPAPSVDGGRSGRWLVHTETIGTGKNRTTYYYTNIILTGSHIPAVIRRSHGKFELIAGASVNGKAYSIGDLGTTGSNDVGGALAGLDPAVSVH